MTWVERSVVKEALAELADASFQERVWLASDGLEMGSVVEAMSALFEDSGLGLALEADEMVFLDAIDGALAELDLQLRQVASGARTALEVLADDRMQSVRERAAGVLFDIVRLEARESRAAET